MVFENNWKVFKSNKFFGKIIVQYNICKTGNRKLIKKTKKQNTKAKVPLEKFSLIFFFSLMPPLIGEWYWARFLEIFSIKKRPKINNSKKNESWFAKTKSSNDIHESYIPVVRVAIPKNDTAPKSDNVSIATNAKPATIAGLADGKMILKKDLYFEKPRFCPNSIKFWDW